MREWVSSGRGCRELNVLALQRSHPVGEHAPQRSHQRRRASFDEGDGQPQLTARGNLGPGKPFGAQCFSCAESRERGADNVDLAALFEACPVRPLCMRFPCLGAPTSSVHGTTIA
jgi:hypothetical protein